MKYLILILIILSFSAGCIESKIQQSTPKPPVPTLSCSNVLIKLTLSNNIPVKVEIVNSPQPTNKPIASIQAFLEKEANNITIKKFLCKLIPIGIGIFVWWFIFKHCPKKAGRT